jgi:hypothetical protein
VHRCRVDRETAIIRLPANYATALTLHAQGRDDEIPERLGIAPEALPTLLRLAEAKLARLVGGSP